MLDQGLDQLWYTWSTSGLGSMAMGYRVRAASEGLRDLQDMRYRRIDRYLRYELPQGVNFSEFDPSTAPISLSFVNNGDERLLIRKVFKGRDAAGRQSVYFSHLIAGLPPEFTARDAIRLWNCPALWNDSEQDKPSNDTHLGRISYNALRAYVEQSQTQFDFNWVREQLIYLVQVILAQGMPTHIYLQGQSALTAALIYGLTHCLPMTMLRNLTFSTYESTTEDHEEALISSITAAELLAGNTSLTMKVVSSFGSQETLQASKDIQDYVHTAFNYLMGFLNAGEVQKFRKMIADAEKKNYTETSDLISSYLRLFHKGPLTEKRLSEIVRHPTDDDNVEDLLSSTTQRDAANMLLRAGENDYWQRGGKTLFAEAVNKIASAPQDQSLMPLSTFISAIVEYVIEVTQSALLQFNEDWSTLNHCGLLLQTLAPPAQNATLWQRLLMQWAQEPYSSRILSDALWQFHLWLLKRVAQMRPPPSQPQIMPWLNIPAWEKLDEVLKLNPPLPMEWERTVIWQRIERWDRIPRGAVAVVQTHEGKFRDLLSYLLQQQNAQSTESVIHFFQVMVSYWYPNHVSLLMYLLSIIRDPSAIDHLFAAVPRFNEHQLVATERDKVLEACSKEVIAACGTSSILRAYIQDYVESLTPNRLSSPSVINFLVQLKTEPMLPSTISTLVVSWLDFTAFLNRTVINRGELERASLALATIMQAVSADLRASFLDNLIPVLVNQVNDEVGLAYVIDTFGQALLSSRWELLRRMAEEAGRGYAHRRALNRLTPYLLFGIREASTSQQPPLTLDSYLLSLYTYVEQDSYKKIEAAISAGVWPEVVQQTWNDWRKRERDAAKGQGGWFGLGKRHTDSQPGQAQETPSFPQQRAQQNLATFSPPLQANMQQQGQVGYQGMPMAPQGKVVLPTPEAAVQTGKHAQPKPVSEFVAVMQKYNEGIQWSTYQMMYPIMQQMLGYWYHVLEAKQGNGSKALAFEINTISQLWQELSGLKKGEVSQNATLYLVDNALIKREIDRLVETKKVSQHAFDMNRFIVAQLDDLRKSIGADHYQQLCASYTEDRMQRGLRILMRRFLFLQYLENNRKPDLQNWLEKERRKAEIILYC